jgi:hypothetical protein
LPRAGKETHHARRQSQSQSQGPPGSGREALWTPPRSGRSWSFRAGLGSPMTARLAGATAHPFCCASSLDSRCWSSSTITAADETRRFAPCPALPCQFRRSCRRSKTTTGPRSGDALRLRGLRRNREAGKATAASDSVAASGARLAKSASLGLKFSYGNCTDRVPSPRPNPES